MAVSLPRSPFRRREDRIGVSVYRREPSLGQPASSVSFGSRREPRVGEWILLPAGPE